MRIGVYIGELIHSTSGGGSTHQETVINQLIKTNSNHEFFIFYKGKLKESYDEKLAQFIAVNEPKIKKSKLPRFLRKKRKKQTDTFLNTKALEHKIEFMWFPALMFQAVDVPYALTIWDLQHRLQTFFPEVSVSGTNFFEREKFYQQCVPNASYIIIGNKAGAKQVEKFYNFPAKRIKTIPLATPQFALSDAMSDDEILTKHGLKKNSFIFYPAQFWPHKNHIRILKALKILQQQGIDLQCVFTGSDKGNETYIKQKVSEFALNEKVKFLGFVKESELVSLYKNASALVFASMFGPDNLPPLEAMALKCPVICSNSDGMEEQLGDAALFFNPLNENELAQKISLLLSDDNLRQQQAAKGYQLAHILTPENHIKKFLDLVDEFAPIRECWSSDEKYVHL
jgi:glycosyltransferase involved in cell wall biosynthesis